MRVDLSALKLCRHGETPWKFVLLIAARDNHGRPWYDVVGFAPVVHQQPEFDHTFFRKSFQCT